MGCTSRVINETTVADPNALVAFGQTMFEINEDEKNENGKMFVIQGSSLRSVKRIEFNRQCICFEPSLDRSRFDPGEQIPIYLHVNFAQMQGRVVKRFSCSFYGEGGISQVVNFCFALNLRKAFKISDEFIMLRPADGEKGKPVNLDISKSIAPLSNASELNTSLLTIKTDLIGEGCYRLTLWPREPISETRFADIILHTNDKGRFSEIRIPVVLTNQ